MAKSDFLIAMNKINKEYQANKEELLKYYELDDTRRNEEEKQKKAEQEQKVKDEKQRAEINRRCDLIKNTFKENKEIVEHLAILGAIMSKKDKNFDLGILINRFSNNSKIFGTDNHKKWFVDGNFVRNNPNDKHPVYECTFSIPDVYKIRVKIDDKNNITTTVSSDEISFDRLSRKDEFEKGENKEDLYIESSTENLKILLNCVAISFDKEPIQMTSMMSLYAVGNNTLQQENTKLYNQLKDLDNKFSLLPNWKAMETPKLNYDYTQAIPKLGLEIIKNSRAVSLKITDENPFYLAMFEKIYDLYEDGIKLETDKQNIIKALKQREDYLFDKTIEQVLIPEIADTLKDLNESKAEEIYGLDLTKLVNFWSKDNFHWVYNLMLKSDMLMDKDHFILDLKSAGIEPSSCISFYGRFDKVKDKDILSIGYKIYDRENFLKAIYKDNDMDYISLTDWAKEQTQTFRKELFEKVLYIAKRESSRVKDDLDDIMSQYKDKNEKDEGEER